MQGGCSRNKRVGIQCRAKPGFRFTGSGVLFLLMLAGVLLIAQRGQAQPGEPKTVAEIRSALAAADNDTLRMKYHKALAHALPPANRSAIFFHLREGLRYAQRLNNAEWRAMMHFNLGQSFQHYAVYDSAERHFQRTLELTRQSGLREKQGYVLNLMGSLARARGQYARARDYYVAALTIATEVQDTYSIAAETHNLAQLWVDEGKLEKALQTFRQAFEQNRKTDNYNWMLRNLLNIAGIYQTLKQYARAEATLFQCLELLHAHPEMDFRYENSLSTYDKLYDLYLQAGNLPRARTFLSLQQEKLRQADLPSFRAQYYLNRGKLFGELNQPDSAQAWYRRAIAQYTRIGRRTGQAFSLTLLGQSLTENQQPAAAEPHLRQALALFDSIRGRSMRQSTLLSLTYCLKATRRPEEALQYLKQYIHLSDSIKNRQKLVRIGQQETRLEFQRRERSRKLYRAGLLAQRTRQNNLQNLLVIGILVAGLSGLLFVRRFGLPVRVVEILTFFTLLLLFEFVLVYLDPWIDRYSGGVPIPKLALNGALALLFTLLHQRIEQRFITRNQPK